MSPSAAAVGFVAVALVWSGTHVIGQAFANTADFAASRWGLGMALVASAGILLASLLVPIDVKAPFDFRRTLLIAGVPLVVIAYSYVALEFGANWVIIDKVAGWANPFGHSALAVMVGIGIASGLSPDR